MTQVDWSIRDKPDRFKHQKEVVQEKKAEFDGDAVTSALAENGNDLLYRYLSREQFERRFGYYHPDPLIDEFSYGEGGGFSAFVWNNINVGSRIFFHTFVGGTRYLTAMYHVMDFAPAGVWRLDDEVKRRRRTPLQADGASKAPPHESGTR